MNSTSSGGPGTVPWIVPAVLELVRKTIVSAVLVSSAGADPQADRRSMAALPFRAEFCTPTAASSSGTAFSTTPASTTAPAAPETEAVALDRFLESLVDDYGSEHVENVREYLSQLMFALGDELPLPIVQPGEEGSIQLAWNRGRQYVDIDVLPSGQIRWFSRDRVENTFSGTDSPTEGVPEELASKLGYFVT